MGLVTIELLLSRAVFLLVFYCFDTFFSNGFAIKAKSSVESWPLKENLPPMPHHKNEKKKTPIPCDPYGAT
jgi:hypothetical protein